MQTLASWNVNSIRTRLDHLRDWLIDFGPDVLGVQETKVQDQDFPYDDFFDTGYHISVAGQKTYNGVAVFSRKRPGEVHTDIPGLDDPQRRVLGVDFGDYYFLNLYVPNGSEVGSEKYAYKLRWLSALHSWLKELKSSHERVVVVGDFNIAPTDDDVHDADKWRDKILCSRDERDALNGILDLGFVDTFRLFEQEPAAFSWWDYRQGSFRRNAGLRIDLVLASDSLQPLCTAAGIAKEPREREKPSDHAPVFARFDL